MLVPIARYQVSTTYLWAALVAVGLAGFSGWLGINWPPCWVATGFFLASAAIVLYLATRPAIEIYESHMRFGSVAIPWRHVRRLDCSARIPLIVRLTLSDKSHLLVVFPADQQTCGDLLRNLRRHAREALIDGVPYRQFWGEAGVPAKRQLPAPRYPLLLPDDEAEVERMYQQLKALGRLEEKTSSEDK